MKNTIIALLVVAAVAGCSRPSGNPKAPKGLDDACSILDQRKDFLPAFRKTQDRYGVPIAVLMSMIWQESKFKAQARTPNKYTLGVIPIGRQSSAYGYSQALDGTWEEYQNLTNRHRAKRDNIYDAAEFMGWYMKQSNIELGIAMNDTRNQYLAYHDGRTGFRKGTYRKKGWLVNIANGLQDRAIMYHMQLDECGKL